MPVAPWLPGQVRTVVACGRVSTTESPLFQVRLTTVKAGPAGALTAAPLTVSRGAVHQPGMRRYSGKASGPGALTVSVTVSAKG